MPASGASLGAVSAFLEALAAAGTAMGVEPGECAYPQLELISATLSGRVSGEQRPKVSAASKDRYFYASLMIVDHN